MSKYWRRRYNWARRGIPVEQIDAVQQAFENATACEICGNDQKLAVDHCHKTNNFRGILCHRCNRALGFFNDEPERLRKAADYLEQLTKTLH